MYIGVTSNLQKRIYEHQNHLTKGFVQGYCLQRLVYYEVLDGVDSAIRREKQLKRWNRQWKIDLVEKLNLQWRDLSKELFGA